MSDSNLLRFQQVRTMTGCTRSMLDRLEKRGAFPTRVKLAARAIAWREADVRAWVASPGDWKDVPEPIADSPEHGA